MNQNGPRLDPWGLCSNHLDHVLKTFDDFRAIRFYDCLINLIMFDDVWIIRNAFEIMFGDFMTLTLDQLLQHACKFHDMYAKRVKVPLIVRTPMGGRRGYHWRTPDRKWTCR